MSQPPIVSQTPVEQLNYEQAFSELESIVTSLETDDHPLEYALALFERGQLLKRYCASLLEQASLKMEQISGEELIDFPLDG